MILYTALLASIITALLASIIVLHGDDDDDEDELFLRMVDRSKAFIFISRRDHCQRFLPYQIFQMPRAAFERAQNSFQALPNKAAQ